MEISIVVVNWNSGAQLYRCVNSIFQYSNDLNVKIIVVDNGSSDNSLELISEFSKVKVIKVGENLGFGKACNLGAKNVKSEFLLFLNPDAEVYQDTLQNTYNFMVNENNQNIGVCGVQLINEKSEVDYSCTWLPTFNTMLARSTGADRIFNGWSYFMNNWDHKNSRKVDHVIGAFYFVRKHVFDSVDGFDERFFVYLEDLDLSLRIKEKGFDIYYLSEIRAFHAGGGVSQQVKARRLFYSWRSRLLYVFKHFGFFQACLILLMTLFIEPFSRSFFAVGRRQWSSVGQTWQACWMLVRWLPRWLLKGETRP